MEGRKSIFELERRIALKDAFEGVLADMRGTYVPTGSGVKRLLAAVVETIKTWPYRDGASSVSDFAKYHGFEYNGGTDNDLIYSFELLLNLMMWSAHCEKMCSVVYPATKNTFLENEHQRCLDNIMYLLTQLNLSVREKLMDGRFSQYIITKRDEDVDAVLEIVPELSELLLSYLDVRNQANVEAKKYILNQIAKFLEPKRSTYDGTNYSKLCDDLFYIFNNCGIRHNNDKQIELTVEQRMNIYDKTFKAAIHLLQKENIELFHQEVKSLKGK